MGKHVIFAKSLFDFDFEAEEISKSIEEAIKMRETLRLSRFEDDADVMCMSAEEQELELRRLRSRAMAASDAGEMDEYFEILEEIAAVEAADTF